MSIDARIHSARRTEKGKVKIYLVPREKGGCAGRSSLEIINFPADTNLRGLVGVEIWGGSSDIMIGGIRWAERVTGGKIRLVPKLNLSEDL